MNHMCSQRLGNMQTTWTKSPEMFDSEDDDDFIFLLCGYAHAHLTLRGKSKSNVYFKKQEMTMQQRSCSKQFPLKPVYKNVIINEDGVFFM